MLNDLLGELIDMKLKRSLTEEYLREAGNNTRITDMLEKAVKAVTSDSNQVAVFRDIGRQNTEFSNLLAHQLVGEEVHDPALQQAVIETIRDGIKRAEPGNQLEQRLGLFSNIVTPRVATHGTWFPAEAADEIAKIALDKGMNNMPPEGAGRQEKIRHDIGLPRK